MKVFTTYTEDLQLLVEGLDHFQFSYLFDYNFITTALKERGAEIMSLSHNDYKDLFYQNKFGLTLNKYMLNSDLIFHNRFLFRQSVASSKDFIKKHRDEVDWLEIKLNSFIYANYKNKAHGVVPPKQGYGEDIRFKDNLPHILTSLGIPTPKLVDGTTYPFYMKHKATSRGAGVYPIKNREQLEATLVTILNENIGLRHAEEILSSYICQEAIDIPTKEQTHFRTICWDKHLLGGAIYVCKNGLQNIIPFKEERAKKLKREEGRILDAYNLNGTILPLDIADYSERIGGYCSRHGSKMVGTDFVVNKAGKAYCVDVNVDPGLEFYLAHYFDDYSYVKLDLLKAKAGEVNAKAIMGDYFKNKRLKKKELSLVY